MNINLNGQSEDHYQASFLGIKGWDSKTNPLISCATGYALLISAELVESWFAREKLSNCAVCSQNCLSVHDLRAQFFFLNTVKDGSLRQCNLPSFSFVYLLNIIFICIIAIGRKVTEQASPSMYR